MGFGHVNGINYGEFFEDLDVNMHMKSASFFSEYVYTDYVPI